MSRIPEITPFDRALATARLALPTAERVRYLREIQSVVRNWPTLVLVRLGVRKEAVLDLSNGEKLPVDRTTLHRAFLSDPRLWRARFSALSHDPRVISGPGFVGATLDPSAFPGADPARIQGPPEIRFWFDSEEEWVNSVDSLAVHFLRRNREGPGLYSHLEVRDRDVVDVGANIADSALYFAARGARHVYAFEPFPRTCGLAQRNIDRSPFRDRVTLLNEGSGESEGSITIDPGVNSSLWSNLTASQVGREVPVSTLAGIVGRYHLRDSVLKMNCEGCEYPTLLGASPEARNAFGQLAIEYHYGCRELVRMLERDGFRVRHTSPILFNNPYSAFGNQMLAGSILADRTARRAT